MNIFTKAALATTTALASTNLTHSRRSCAKPPFHTAASRAMLCRQ